MKSPITDHRSPTKLAFWIIVLLIFVSLFTVRLMAQPVYGPTNTYTFTLSPGSDYTILWFGATPLYATQLMIPDTAELEYADNPNHFFWAADTIKAVIPGPPYSVADADYVLNFIVGVVDTGQGLELHFDFDEDNIVDAVGSGGYGVGAGGSFAVPYHDWVEIDCLTYYFYEMFAEHGGIYGSSYNICTNTISTNVFCGSILSPGTLNPTSYQVCVGGSLGPIGITGTDVTNGWVHTVVNNCFNGILSTNMTPLSYDVQIQFNPPLPAVFNTAGTSTHDALLVAIPTSHTNSSCTLTASLGQITVTAVTTQATNYFVTCGTITNNTAVNLTNIICIGGSASPPSLPTNYFGAGQLITVVTDCTYNTNSSTTNPITYTPTNRFVPAIPTTPFTAPTTMVFNAFVDGISSSPFCPNLSVPAGTFTLIASKVDIQQTTVKACVDSTATFSVTGDTVLPVTWSIGGSGAQIIGSNTGASITVSTGTNATDYSVTAIDQWGVCSDSATLRVQRLKIDPSDWKIFVNHDDDNTNGVFDVNEPLSGAASEVSGENNLVPLQLQAQNYHADDQVTLTSPTHI